jgi:uncharacterized protein (TIGR02757 family)
MHSRKVNKLAKADIQEILDQAIEQFNHRSFIENDPIRIPHLFQQRQDIEIAGFLVALISWGNRKAIINRGLDWMEVMGNEPYRFVMDANPAEWKELSKLIYRTLSSEDIIEIGSCLKRAYSEVDSLEHWFQIGFEKGGSKEGISHFREAFFKESTLLRAQKHVGNPAQNSAAKRVNMFLRWMVRKDVKGVDFGIWNNIPMSELSIPLDVHSGNIARELKLLSRKADDWKAVEELDSVLRSMNPTDPVIYDFALFGIGVNR